MRELPPPNSLGKEATTDAASLSDLMTPSLGRAVRVTFARMEIAEDEIKAAKARFPEHRVAIHSAFSILCPTDPIRDLSDEVFRLHCRELLERVASGADVGLATTAEVLGFLADASLLAPPTRAASLLYQDLFARLYPQWVAELPPGSGTAAADPYEIRETAALERSLRARLRVVRP